MKKVELMSPVVHYQVPSPKMQLIACGKGFHGVHSTPSAEQVTCRSCRRSMGWAVDFRGPNQNDPEYNGSSSR